MEDRRRGRVAFEDAAKRMLRYLEDSEDLKVGMSELNEQLETPEEEGPSIMQIAQQARNEKGQKIFDIFRQGEEEVCIASLARWDTQLKGPAELERRCQGMMQEVKPSSERKEVLKGMVEDKIRLQRKATEKYFEKILEEMRELEERKSKGALLLVQKTYFDAISKGEGEGENVAKIGRIKSGKKWGRHLINALKLLANQQKDGDSPVQSIVTGLCERSRKGF